MLHALALGVALTGVTAAVSAGPAAAASSAFTLPSWPSNPDWKSYVESNDAAMLTPVAATATGDVTNPQALTSSGSGVTTLTYTAGQTPPVVILDYGKEVGGLPDFAVSSVSPAGSATSVDLKAGYSELQQYLLGASPSTTLSAAPAAGATNVKVASVTNFAAGQPLTIDSGSGAEQVTVTSVGTAGASGTGISFTPALAQPHASGATVSTTVKPVVGDANGNNGVGTDSRRTDTFTVTSASAGTTVGNAVTAVQGGERYEAITLNTPGTVSLSAAGIKAEFNNAGPDAYKGYFVSSDDTLNKIWYDGVYTTQTDGVPAGGVCSSATTCSQAPTILDGAKRDRRPWSGDLSVEGRTLFDSLGFNASGSDYIKDTIGGFGSSPSANGEICGQTSNWISYPASKVSCSVYSPSYSMYYPINLSEYYLYSGDTAFAESQYQVLKNELAYENSTIDPTTGLSTASGRDWDFYDGSKGGAAAQGGAAAATNMLSYQAHAQGAWLASQLAAQDPTNADAATWTADAAAWSSQAASLKSAINAKLFDASKGVYQLTTSDNGTHPAASVPQDANSQAIAFGIAPASSQTGILSYLQNNLWGTYGPQPYSADAGYSTIVSPFVSGYELDARFDSGDTASALALTKTLWAPMVDKSGPNYTGTLWEKLGQGGSITDSNASLSHGWSTAPVSAFDSYLLGATPIDPGYATWQVKPQPGDLGWAQGQVPTAGGQTLGVKWAQNTANGSFHMQVVSPSGTGGQVWVPLASAGSTSLPLTAGTTFLRHDGNYDVYQVGAGTYNFASVAASTCTSGAKNGPLTIASGEFVCLTSGGKINGPVSIASGGSLWIDHGSIAGPVSLATGGGSLYLNGATVNGPVSSSAAASMTVTDTHIAGPVSINGATGAVVLGGTGTGAGDTISGPVTITGNTGGVTFSANTVNGPLSIQHNRGGFTYGGNKVSGPTSVSDNS
jgi:alpha-L-rhamnosidase